MHECCDGEHCAELELSRPLASPCLGGGEEVVAMASKRALRAQQARRLAILRQHAKRERCRDGEEREMPEHAPDFYDLHSKGVPKAFLRLLFILVMHPGISTVCNVDVIEFFSGVGNLVRAMVDGSLVALPYELLRSQEAMDILKPAGFAVACVMALRLRSNGLAWFGTVCSSWVFLCSATSERTKFLPMGNESLSWVREANLMVSRCCLLMRLVHAKGAWWCLEQPLSSVMVYHNRMQELATHWDMWSTSFEMESFGAETSKPTKIYGNRKHVGALASMAQKHKKQHTKRKRNRKVEVVKSHFDKEGRRRVSGGKDLKATSLGWAWERALFVLNTCHS